MFAGRLRSTTGTTFRSSDTEPDTAIDKASTVGLFELCTNNREALLDQIQLLEAYQSNIDTQALPLPEVTLSDLDFYDIDGADFMESGEYSRWRDYSDEELDELRLKALERMNQEHIDTALQRKAKQIATQEIITELRAAHNEWRTLAPPIPGYARRHGH